MDEDQNQGKAVKQHNLDTFSKEELLGKCKSLLTILKKAKIAKDEAVADTEKLKCEQAKVIHQLEEERNKAEKETETFQEIVSNLTENKMVLVTKNESIQRQLNLQVNEVEALKQVEKTLLLERENYHKENEKLKVTVAKQQRVVEQMKEEREKKNHDSNSSWQSEKENLIDKIESLEAQIGQIDVLKNKYKNLVEENKIAEEKLKEMGKGKKSSFEEEEKAMQIVHNELKSQKIVLEERIKSCEKENEEFRKSVAEAKLVQERLTTKEEAWQQCKRELDEVNASRNDLKQSYEEVSSKIEEMKQELIDQVKENLDLNVLYKEVKEKLESQSESNQSAGIQTDRENKKDEVEEESELKLKLDQLESENKSHSEMIQNLTSEKEMLTNFYSSINNILNPEAQTLSNEELLTKLHSLKTKDFETTSTYDDLKSDTLKLTSLVNHLFCLKEAADFNTEDINSVVNMTYSNLESTIKEFKNSDFEVLCNKCSSDVKEFCDDVAKLEDLLSSDPKESVKSMSELSSNEIFAKPLTNLMCNLRDVCMILSRFFSFELVPQLINNIDTAQNKTKALSELILNTFNNQILKEKEVAKLIDLLASQKETSVNQQSRIDDQDQIIQTFETNLKELKQKYNEDQQLKGSKDEAMKDITSKYKEVAEALEQSQNNLVENQEKINELELKIQSLEKDANEMELLKKKLESVERELEESVQSNASSHAETENSNSQLQKLTMENSTLNGKLELTENQLQEALQTNESIRGEKNVVEAQLETLNKDRKLLQDKLITLERELADQINCNKELEDDAGKIKSELTLLIAENDSLKDKIDTLENKLSDSTESKVIECESLIKENYSLKEKLTDLESKICISETVIKENDSLKETVDCLESKLMESKSQVEEKDLLRDKVTTMQNELSNSETVIKENDLLKEKLMNLESKLVQCEATINENNLLKEKLIVFESKVSESEAVTKENDRLKERLVAFETNMTETSQCNETLNVEITQIKAEIQSLIKENNGLKERLTTMAGQLKNSESLIEENNSVNEKLVALESKLADFSSVIEKNESLKGKLATAESKLADFESITNENGVLKEKLSTLERSCSESEQLFKENNSLKEEIASLESKLSDLDTCTKEKDELQGNFSSLETQLAEYKEKNTLLIDKVGNLESKSIEFETVSKKNNLLKEKVAAFKKEIFDLKNVGKENKSLKAKLTSLEIKLSESAKCNESLNNNLAVVNTVMETLTQENDLLKTKVTSFEKELMESVLSTENFNKTLSDIKHQLAEARLENDSLKRNVKTLETNVIGCVQSYKSSHDDGKESSVDAGAQSLAASSEEDRTERMAANDASSRHADIISELNEMNQVILKRGERISNLVDEIRKKTSENETLCAQLQEAQAKLCVETEKVHSSTSQQDSSSSMFQDKIRSLEEENSQLKKALENESAARSQNASFQMDAQSEVMSTSTISRMEESHRLKEMEDTFEERYMKLKSVALKLKKKLAEQSVQIRSLEEAKQKACVEKEEMAKKIGVVGAKNIQVLQAEIDRLQDSLDESTKQRKETEKQLIAAAQDSSDLKSKFVSTQEENLQLSNRIKVLEESVSGHENLSESLQGQVVALEQRLALEEKRFASLKEEQRLGEGRLQEERRGWDLLRRELEELKQDNKKHSLIDLEMKDYERSIDDLTAQVKEREQRAADLQLSLDNAEGKRQALSEEISLLKEQVESETDRAQKLKKASSDYKIQVSELRRELDSMTSEKERDRLNIERLNQELEKQKLSMSEMSSGSSQVETKLRKAKESAESKVELLEEKMEKSVKQIDELKSELDILQKEYEAYKIRAQSVLRQKAKVPQESYEQLTSEKEQLSADLEVVTLRTHQLQAELAASKADIGLLSNEKERLSFQLCTVTSEMSKKEVSSQEAVSSLEKKLETKCAEYQLVISNMSEQTESMQKSFKSQLESQKEKHARELKKLEMKVEETEEKLWQLKNSSPASLAGRANGKQDPPDAVSSLAPHHIRKASHGGAAVEDHRIDVTNMIREEGEGSEWVEPLPQRSPSQQLYSPPSLEQLISTPFPPLQPLSPDEALSVVSAATENSLKEAAKWEAKVSGCELRIQQLTTLLTESEAENAKLGQLAEALKEEIRRASRNETREKHLENNEYIKNVILKFLHLKTGDEKFRLVPVLKTLLQLSPDETSKLAVIARGEDSQNLPQGWGNYLHLWSGR